MNCMVVVAVAKIRFCQELIQNLNCRVYIAGQIITQP